MPAKGSDDTRHICQLYNSPNDGRAVANCKWKMENEAVSGDERQAKLTKNSCYVLGVAFIALALPKVTCSHLLHAICCQLLPPFNRPKQTCCALLCYREMLLSSKNSTISMALKEQQLKAALCIPHHEIKRVY